MNELREKFCHIEFNLETLALEIYITNELTRLTNNIARQYCFRQAPEVISAKNNTVR